MKKEGKALNHCVGGYAERMAEGKIAIFFVRSAGDPDKPYFTLELVGKNITQCRTTNNKSYDGEVKEFVDLWFEKIVKKGGRKQKTKASA